MAVATLASRDELLARAYALPIDALHPGDPELFRTDALWPYFARLRDEDPVHYCADSEFGAYWSVTKFQDIVAVDTRHDVFSSAARFGGATLYERPAGFGVENFTTTDPPGHADKRKVVQPAVAPANLQRLAPLVRERASRILDDLPIGETFNWVERVSVALTIQMLATLFDFPFDQRDKLAYWSDVASCLPAPGLICETAEQRETELRKCLAFFTELWKQRENRPEGDDLLSMLAHNPATRDMSENEFMGTLILLILGGNDTTRNSITGGVVALNQFPEQYEKLRSDHGLVASMVPEIVRWQTPIAHQRRTALHDVEFGGKTILKGDRVVMWYVSGNRDEDEIERPNDFIIDRDKPRHHLSFGFGVHRCVGNRLAELQLRIVWEEILKRFHSIEVMGEPQRVRSNTIRGYRSLPVRIHA